MRNNCKTKKGEVYVLAKQKYLYFTHFCIQGESCRFLSDTTHEIRLEDNVDATSESAMANNINAFLNSGLGGRFVETLSNIDVSYG